MAGTGNGGTAGQDAVLGVLIELISGICGIDEDELTADRSVVDLGIDSLMAGEIMAQAEMALNADIDFRRLADDWSDLTVGKLASQLAAEIHPGA
jgi:acyl carrier protein